MSAKKNQFPYQITVSWSAQDEAYLASVPAIRHCIAYGETPTKALKEVTLAAVAMLEALRATGKPVPATDIGLARLLTMGPVLNLSAIAREAGLSVQTLASKLKRGTALTEDERAKVGNVLAVHGVIS